MLTGLVRVSATAAATAALAASQADLGIMTTVHRAFAKIALAGHGEARNEPPHFLAAHAFRTLSLIRITGGRDLFEFELTGIAKKLVKGHLLNSSIYPGGVAKYCKHEGIRVLTAVSDPIAQLDRAPAF